MFSELYSKQRRRNLMAARLESAEMKAESAKIVAEIANIDARISRHKFRKWLATHPQMWRLSSRQQAATGLVFMFLVAIYFVDCLLLGAVAEFFVQRTFHDSAFIINLGRMLLPAAILILELFISVQRLIAREAVENDLDSKAPYYGWTLLGTLLSCVIPSAVLATYMASNFGFSVLMSSALLTTLLGISLTAHLSVVYSGRLVLEALSHLIFSGKAWFLGLRSRRLSTRAKRRAQKASRLARLHAYYMADCAKLPPELQHSLSIRGLACSEVQISGTVSTEDLPNSSDANELSIRRKLFPN